MVNISQEKQGYKYTEEFGYIPEDWDIVSLDDLVAKDGLIRGPFGGTLKKEYFVNNGYKVYEQGNAIYGSVELGNYYIDNEKFKELKRFEVKEGDFIVSCSGTIGKIYRLPKRLPKGIINQALLKITINENVISSDFFQIMFNWSKVQNSIIDSTQGGAMKNLVGMPIFKKTKMLKPQPLEQEKIAEVLGDIDSLIDKTQQLINKKKDIKTATMQKLLTPKEGWKFKTIDSLGESISVKNLSWEDTNVDGKTKCILYGELFTTYNEVAKNIVSKTNKEVYLAKINDLLFPTSTTVDNMSLIAPSCLQENNVGVGGDLFVFRPYNSNGIFLSYLINGSLDIKRQLANRAQGLTIIHLHYDNIKDIELPIPDKIEQDKIATILSDMDAEIEALEKELSKYKDLKIGMMQQLLTGKIRLLDKVAQQERKVVSMEDVATHKVANDEFKDAILISALAHKFGSEKYPLGAFRRQKLSYFYKRHANMNIDEYTKKAMGPYNSKIKYHGAENIAIRNGYVKNVGGRGIVATNLISKAEEYYNRYYNSADMQWLDANFHYENNNNLEVLATVDYAINDLVSQNKAITLANIKTYIASDEEWKPKLDLDYFTDNNIVKAMEKIKRLFNSY